MSVFDRFDRAREVLELGPQDDAVAAKRAYRRKVLVHPPDTDPEGFRRVRAAFELLSDPGAQARDLLLRPLPDVAPPPAPSPSPPLAPGALPLAILRVVAAQLDVDALGDPAPPAESHPARPAEKRSP